MVRGRRVRAVVTCANNDDCCSPNPKRKDQKITANGKLSHTVLASSKQTIKDFFQVVDIDYKTEPIRSSKRKQAPTTLMLDDVNVLNGFTDIGEFVLNNFAETPKSNKIKPVDSSLPPTPHRIELRPEPIEEVIKREDDEPKLLPPPEIVQRRLIVNEEVNKEETIKKLPVNKKKEVSHELTEFFPVRRSVRKTKKTVLEEKQRLIELAVRNGKEDGLKVCNFEGKGRGVVADKDFEKGEFVVEYCGDLIEPSKAQEREEQYAQDQNTGCYMYYFKHNGQQYCIDATAESGKLGRLVNHSRYGNLLTRTIIIDKKPRLVLIAKEDIKKGTEVLYDYGDRSKESLKHHPWLAN